ncbi:MAG TPA: AIPR family protein [Methyloceanibacter sp.]|nr:AIPR family protein [Methyloceanibacter sp.]
MTKTHTLRVAQARRFSNSTQTETGSEKHIFLVRCSELPSGLSKEANARDFEGRDLNKRVYRDVRDTLTGNIGIPGTFDLLNKGITVIADSVRRLNDNEYEVVIGDGQGIVDGGHTYDIICDTKEKTTIPDSQFVEVRIFTGIPSSWIAEISMGLNTGIAVKEHSLAFLDGKYGWLQDEMEKSGFKDLIAWRESDVAHADVRDLIATMEALNIFDFPNGGGQNPVAAYEKWSGPAKKFAADFDRWRDSLYREPSTYHRLRPLLRGGLILMDYIRAEFRDAWNEEIGGRAGGLAIVEEAKRADFEFPFAGLPGKRYRLTKGAAYPIFAAFRNLVQCDSETGDAYWSVGEDGLIDFWEETKPVVLRTVKQAIQDFGHKPDVLGKNRGFWNLMHQSLELHVLRKKNAVAA